MNGGHGQIVQQHVVKESKQEPEHLPMMLQTLASHSLSKKVVPFLQLIGGHGQTVLQHAVMVSRQEQELVLTFKKFPPIIQKHRKERVYICKNAVTILGQHGVHGIPAPIVVPVRIKNNVHGVNLSKLRVHKKVNRFKPRMKHKIVVGQAIGVPVRSKIKVNWKHNYLYRTILRRRSCKYDPPLSEWM